MAKYYRFTFSAGYIGTDEIEIYKFDDNASESEVSEVFDDWYDNMRKDSGDFQEISEEKAKEEGIDEDLSGED